MRHEHGGHSYGRSSHCCDMRIDMLHSALSGADAVGGRHNWPSSPRYKAGPKQKIVSYLFLGYGLGHLGRSGTKSVAIESRICKVEILRWWAAFSGLLLWFSYIWMMWEEASADAVQFAPTSKLPVKRSAMTIFLFLRSELLCSY